MDETGFLTDFGEGFPKWPGKEKGYLLVLFLSYGTFLLNLARMGGNGGWGTQRHGGPEAMPGAALRRPMGGRRRRQGPWHCGPRSVALRAALRGTASRAPWYCGPRSVVLRTKGGESQTFSGDAGSSRRGSTTNKGLAFGAYQNRARHQSHSYFARDDWNANYTNYTNHFLDADLAD